MRGAQTGYAADLRGGGRIARGLIVSLIAVVSTALAHYTVTGHAPALLTVLFAFAITAPVCIGLSRVPRSRTRLAVAVLAGQVFLHMMFGPGPAVGVEDHQHQLLIHTEPSSLLVHFLALMVTYTAVRRGDELVQMLQLLLEMSLFRNMPEVADTVTYPVHTPSAEKPWTPVESRPGEGPNPLRGPPALVS
ncbi:hypothetical protein [Nesterenkonia massiliensis]|uniref:hypothetical protein n=1 Tax=Nesterenkonia massiliensis TaxID=1232429 RepID=UPI000410D217|nr:hypothetical protein [Nesterenkonia massiliensis]